MSRTRKITTRRRKESTDTNTTINQILELSDKHFTAIIKMLQQQVQLHLEQVKKYQISAKEQKLQIKTRQKLYKGKI